MHKKAAILCFFIVVSALIVFARTSYAADKSTLSIHTYYPAPEIRYNNVDTAQYYSPETRVYGELRKDIEHTGVPNMKMANFRAAISPKNVGDTSLGSFFSSENFTSLDAANIQSFITSNTPNLTELNIIANQVNAQYAIQSGAAAGDLVTNQVENVLRLGVYKDGGISSSEFQYYERWPGLGKCRKVLNQGMIGILATDCKSNEYLRWVTESPGIVLAFHMGGNNTDPHDNSDFALALSGGLKIGTFSYACCELYQDAEATQPIINTACQGVTSALQTIDPATLTQNLSDGPLHQMWIDLAHTTGALGSQCDGPYVLTGFGDPSRTPFDTTTQCKLSDGNFQIAVDAKTVTVNNICVPVLGCFDILNWTNGSDGEKEYYCYGATAFANHYVAGDSCNAVFTGAIDGLGNHNGTLDAPDIAIFASSALGIPRAQMCSCLSNFNSLISGSSTGGGWTDPSGGVVPGFPGGDPCTGS